VDKRGRRVKKVTTLQTAMTKKGRQFFRKKIEVTPSVAAPVTPTLVTPLTFSDLTDVQYEQQKCY